MEGDLLPDFLIEEAVGKSQEIPMTPFQEYYLINYIDPEVDRLIENLEREKTQRVKYEEYLKRTIPTLHQK